MTTSRPPASARWFGSCFRYAPALLFAAGFISVLVFQQGALAILNAAGVTQLAPFPTVRTAPFGVPQIWSFAFWGGLWGLAYGFFEKWFPARALPYVLVAMMFGAAFPSAVLWFVVFPLKGIPAAAGFDAVRMATHLVLHAAWGLGMALMLRQAT